MTAKEIIKEVYNNLPADEKKKLPKHYPDIVLDVFERLAAEGRPYPLIREIDLNWISKVYPEAFIIHDKRLYACINAKQLGGMMQKIELELAELDSRRTYLLSCKRDTQDAINRWKRKNHERMV